MGDNPEFGRISNTQKSAFNENLMANKGKLERLQNIVTREKATTPSPACSTNEPFVLTIDVLNSVGDSNPQLPVATDGTLTHIQLELRRPQ